MNWVLSHWIQIAEALSGGITIAAVFLSNTAYISKIPRKNKLITKRNQKMILKTVIRLLKATRPSRMTSKDESIYKALIYDASESLNLWREDPRKNIVKIGKMNLRMYRMLTLYNQGNPEIKDVIKSWRKMYLSSSV